jgi:2-iminobutanoate/2-iminopropanoate deaminase
VFTSGMGGLDPTTGQVVSDDVIEQSLQAIKNVEAILAGAGCKLTDVIKANRLPDDMADYARVDKIYDEAFHPHRPARTCVAVLSLPVRERMKIETIAIRKGASATLD